MSNTPFSSLPLPQALLSNLTDLGYEAMTTVQAQALPAVLAGQDVIAQAKTGSGKTATFGLGLLAQLQKCACFYRVIKLSIDRNGADTFDKLLITIRLVKADKAKAFKLWL